MKQLIKWAGFVLLAFSLASCGGGGGSAGTVSNSATLATDAPSGLTILVGTIRQFDIKGGKGPYSAISNNELVAVTTVSGSQLLIGTVGIGTATINVHDSAGATTAVSLTSAVAHPFVTTAPGSVTLQTGSTQSFQLSGGVPGYSASSSNSAVVTAVMDGSSVQLTGGAAGTATVTVSDGIGETVSISVTVQTVGNLALFTTAPPSLSMAVGDTQTFQIGGGSGSYLLSSDNSAVVKVPSTSTGPFTIAASAVGSAHVQITDTTNSKTLTVAVTVASGLTTLATTAPSTVSIATSTHQTYSISGGSGAYVVTNTNPFNVGATVTGNGPAGGTLTLSGLLVGSSTVTVRDSAGSQVVLTVNVIPPGNVISLLPGSLTVSESDAPFEIDLQIFGGTAPYHAFTSDLTITNVAVSGTTLKVNVTNGTNACVTADTPVTLTVMDSQGATATSTLTIKNVNASCP